MKKTPIALALASCAIAIAQTAPLSEPKARITDEAIHGDRLTYEAVQTRIQTLNTAGRPLSDYHLAKAQCWLDASRHEYDRNDRSAFPRQALDESARLVDAIEKHRSPMPLDTPFVDGATELRPDLWKQIAELKASSTPSCAPAKLACSEVALVHAGHESSQWGWRHANPYVQMAESLLVEAKGVAGSCAALR